MNKNLENNKDHIFTTNDYPIPFSFNSNVVEVFDDMIARSVPMYDIVNSSIVDWSKKFYRKDSFIIDIGSSTGTAILSLYKNIEGLKAKGFDLSEAMVKKANFKLDTVRKDFINKGSDIEFTVKDAFDVCYHNASVVIMTYTLQFIEKSKRLALLKKIHEEMLLDGIFYLSDKVLSDVDDFSEIEKDLYESFKESNGYSRVEIERKKQALKNVLVPLKFSEELDLLKQAGFKDIDPIIRWNNFVSIVARKS